MILSNVTERKQAEEALRQSEEHFRNLIEGSIQGIIIHRDFKPLFANRAYANMLGYERAAEVLAMTSMEPHILPHERARLRRYEAARMEGEEAPVQYEYEAVRKDGSLLVLQNVERVIDWQGRPATQSTIIDITERKRAEEALRQSEEHFRNLIEGSIQGIIIHRDFKPLFANRAYANMLGYERAAEVLAMTSMEPHILPHERARLRRYEAARMEGEEAPVQYEYEAVRKDGSLLVLQNVERVIDWQGRPATQSTVIDDTERKRAERMLRESEKELHVLSSQLINAQENERKRIASELHDGIGQSLSAIKFSVENCLNTLNDETLPVSHDLLKGVVPKIQNTIEEVRRIAMDLRPAMLDDLGVLSALQWFCREFHHVYPSIKVVKQLKIREDEVPNTLKVVIYRIVQEALNNVAKHAGASLVSLDLETTEAGIKLAIKDNGQGFRMNDYWDVNGGRLGFGLKSMRERAELTGGIPRIEASLGKGASVHVLWPASELELLGD